MPRLTEQTERNEQLVKAERWNRPPYGGQWQAVGLTDIGREEVRVASGYQRQPRGKEKKRKDVDPSEQWRTWACLVNGGRVLANGSDM